MVIYDSHKLLSFYATLVHILEYGNQLFMPILLSQYFDLNCLQTDKLNLFLYLYKKLEFGQRLDCVEIV